MANGDASTPPPKPINNRWAFLVGVNRYTEHRSVCPDLNYCVNDVRSLATLLAKVGYTVVCLHDELGYREPRFPRRGNVEAEFKQLCGNVGPDDLLLVYFACHGTRQGDGKPRLILEDTRFATLETTGLEVAKLEAWMRDTSAQRLVMMLDACHIGLGTDQRAVADPEFIHNVYELATGFELLAASTDEQAAYELGGMQHGLFSYFVLSGLSGKAQQDDGLVTVGALRHYVLNEMAKQGVKDGIPQDPRQRKEGSWGDMILVDYRNQPLPQLPNAPETGAGASSKRESAAAPNPIINLKMRRFEDRLADLEGQYNSVAAQQRGAIGRTDAQLEQQLEQIEQEMAACTEKINQLKLGHG